MSTETPRRGRANSGRGPLRTDPADAEQLREYPVSTRRITRLFRPYKWRVRVVSALIVVTSLVGLSQPFLVKRALDGAIPPQDVALLGWIGLGMVGIHVASAVVGLRRTW